MSEKKGLQVINASYSKTGTKTMHEAFEILGYKVCDAHENVYRLALVLLKDFWNFSATMISGRKFGMLRAMYVNTFTLFTGLIASGDTLLLQISRPTTFGMS